MKYTPVKSIYIPQEITEAVISPWVLKVLYRRKKEALKRTVKGGETN